VSNLDNEVFLYSFKVSALGYFNRRHDSIIHEFKCLNIL